MSKLKAGMFDPAAYERGKLVSDHFKDQVKDPDTLHFIEARVYCDGYLQFSGVDVIAHLSDKPIMRDTVKHIASTVMRRMNPEGPINTIRPRVSGIVKELAIDVMHGIVGAVVFIACIAVYNACKVNLKAHEREVDLPEIAPTEYSAEGWYQAGGAK